MIKQQPNHCPECGGTNISAVSLWKHSQWLADPSNPDWEPFHGTSYDTYCYDCEMCFDISPENESDLYWYDEYPESLPEGGNKIYSDVLLKRSYDMNAERCGNCKHFFNGFIPIEGSSCSKLEIYCKLDKEKKVSYYKPCIFIPSNFLLAWFYEVDEKDGVSCCMNCEHQGMQYCPFNKGYTGWDDVYCNKWEPRGLEDTAN